MSLPLRVILAVSALSQVSSDSRQSVNPYPSSRQIPHHKSLSHSYNHQRLHHQQPHHQQHQSAHNKYYSGSYTRQHRGLPSAQSASRNSYQRNTYPSLNYKVAPRIINRNHRFSAQQKRPRKIANSPLKLGSTNKIENQSYKTSHLKHLNSQTKSKNKSAPVVSNHIRPQNPKPSKDKTYISKKYPKKKINSTIKKKEFQKPHVTKNHKPTSVKLKEKSFKPSPSAPKFIIKQAGPSQQFGWVGHGEFAPLNIPNIFKAAGINTKWIPEDNKIFEAGLLYPAPAQDKLLVETAEKEPKQPYFSVSKHTSTKPIVIDQKIPVFSVSKHTTPKAVTTIVSEFPPPTFSSSSPKPVSKEVSTSKPNIQIKLSSNTNYKVISSAPPTYDTSTASKEPFKQTTTNVPESKFPTLWRSSTPGYKGNTVSPVKYHAAITYRPPNARPVKREQSVNPFLLEKKLPSLSLPSFKTVETPALPPKYKAVETPAFPPNYIEPRNPFLKEKVKNPPAPVYFPKTTTTTTTTPKTSSISSEKVISYGSQSIDLSKYQTPIIKTTYLSTDSTKNIAQSTTPKSTTPKLEKSTTARPSPLFTKSPTTSSYLFRSSPSFFTPQRPSYQPAPSNFPIYPSVIQEEEKIPTPEQLTEDKRLTEVPTNSVKVSQTTGFGDVNENSGSDYRQIEEKEDDEVFFIFYENEQNPVEESFANGIDLKRFIQEELNNVDPGSVLSASVPEGDIFSDPNEVPVFSVIEEVEEVRDPKQKNPVFYDVPIKIEESGEGFDPPSDIRTIFVPIENAINVPNTYDISVGTSFGYNSNRASQENSFSSFLSDLDKGYNSAYDSPISSYDAPIAPTSQGAAFNLSSEDGVTLGEYRYPEKKSVRRVRKPKTNRKTRKQKSYPQETKSHSIKQSLPYGTRYIPREKYDPLDIIKRK